MFKILFLLILLITFSHKSVSDTILYHEYQTTSSGFKIIEWNINPDSLPVHYIQERVDNKGRVKMIELFESGETIKSYLCDFAAIISFDYPNDSTIVETKFDAEGVYGGNIECGNPTKTTYTFSPKKYQLKSYSSEYILSEEIQKWWLTEGGYTEEKLNKMLEVSKESGDDPYYIFWYLYSYNKLNGVFPVGRNLDIEKIYLSEKIKSRIIETLPETRVH